MKATFRIPAKEQYGFIELIEVEVASAEEALTAYEDIVSLYKGSGEGLEHKEWCGALDRYLKDGTMDSDTYLKMSLSQQKIIQEIKKAVKRINYKNENTN